MGLAFFLNKAGVPGYETGHCACRMGFETPRHVLMCCNQDSSRRDQLRDSKTRQVDLEQLLDNPDKTGLASRWVIRLGRLLQFPLTKELLYE
jgi:hypothetical protein